MNVTIDSQRKPVTSVRVYHKGYNATAGYVSNFLFDYAMREQVEENRIEFYIKDLRELDALIDYLQHCKDEFDHYVQDKVIFYGIGQEKIEK